MLQHHGEGNQALGLLQGIKKARSVEVRHFVKLFIFKLTTIAFRNDYSIEIWNLANAPFLERTIPGSLDKTVEVLCWAGSRLFTVGLSGDGVKEWDLQTLTPKRSLLLTGEKGICMDYNKATETIVIGTEEGIINIFDISDDDIQFVKVLDRQDHRVICCKFNEAGDKLVTGSFDAVKVWNIKTGHVDHKMSTGRADPGQETIVWCVDILSDFTIISGDSRGKITFWDGTLGTQIDYIHASAADIMCLAITEDRKHFFCSGVEQILKKYAAVKTMKNGIELEQWVRCAKRSKIHTHDVLAMVVIGDDKFISGGIDGFLSFGTQDFKSFDRAGPFLKQPFVESAEEGRLILMKYVNYLEVWKLASAKELDNEPITETDSESILSGDDIAPVPSFLIQKPNPIYKLDVLPEKVLELRSKDDDMIVSCAISNDGHWIAYSTINSIRIFQFEMQENAKPKMRPIKTTPEEFKPCINMIFSKDSNSIVTVNAEGHCSVFELESEAIEHKETFDLGDHHSDQVHLVEMSSCSSFLVLASLCNNISVWTLVRNKWTHSKTLPKYGCPATSLNIRRNQPHLVVAFSDSKLLEYNLDDNCIQFTASLPSKTPDIASVITNISLDPRNDNAIIFCQNNSINVLMKNSEKVSNKKAKITKLDPTSYTTKVVKTFNTVCSLFISR